MKADIANYIKINNFKRKWNELNIKCNITNSIYFKPIEPDKISYFIGK